MDKSPDYEYLPVQDHTVIEGVWRLSAEAGDDRIAPDTRCEIIFHLGQSPQEWMMGEWRDQPQQLIYGPLTQVLNLRRKHPMSLYAVRLRPAGIGMLDSGPRRLRNQSAPLSQVLDSGKCLSLGEAAGNRLRDFATVAQNVIGRPRTQIDRESRVSMAINKIEEQPALRSKQMAASLGVSVRTLNRDFMRSTGLTPGEFSRIHRYHTARCAMQEKRHALSDIAVSSGYSDQAHMTREFRHFAGLSPRAKRNNTESDFFYI